MPSLPETIAVKLKGMADRLAEVDRLLATPEVSADPARLCSLAKERGGLADPVEAFSRWDQAVRRLAEAEELASDQNGDPELRALAESELDELRAVEKQRADELQEFLIRDYEDEDRDVIMEIRAGTGGEEAALFAADIFRMYTLYAEHKGWKVELIDENKTDLRGYKEVVFSIHGKGAYRYLRLESGTHRVQRVPVTEASGRIHTSVATVAVLPEVEDVEIEIRDDDLKIDTFCASGPGGQHVNKTSSAVRITHLPTGLVVSCQDEKSQHRNKSRALRVLRSRLYQSRLDEQQQEIAQKRREQIGSGERSEKIRTYNFPQNRLTDHRAGISRYNLQEILQGKLDDLILPLLEWHKQERLKRL